MSHIPVLRIGQCGVGGLDSSGRAPIESIASDPSGYDYGIGANLAKVISFVPLTLQANNIATSAIVNGAATLTAGTGVTLTTFNGAPAYDITGGAFERAIQIVGQAGGVTAVNFTINGYDAYGQPVSCTFLGPAATATTVSPKTFRYVTSITSAATTTAAVTIGTADTFGFPARVDNWDQCLIFWNNALITATTGFTAADTTNPATASTGNVRGKYAAQSASDGTKRMRMIVWLDNPDNMNNAYGIKQA